MIALLVWVLIVGVLAWVIQSLPIPDPFKKVAYAILIIILILAVASLFGVVSWPNSGVVVR